MLSIDNSNTLAVRAALTFCKAIYIWFGSVGVKSFYNAKRTLNCYSWQVNNPKKAIKNKNI